MTTYSHLPPEERQRQYEQISHRWSEFVESRKVWRQELLKYLFLANAGSAAALLAFIGTSEAIRDQTWSRWSLFLFALGLVFVGLTHFFEVYTNGRLFTAFRKGMGNYYLDKVTLENLYADDMKRSSETYGAGLLMVISFLLFVAALFLSGWNFLPWRT